MAGEEVAQLYIRDLQASVTRPVKELRGFQRVWLKPGAKRKVAFVLGPDDLSFTGLDKKRIVEPGVFEVMAGGNSVDLVRTTFEVVGTDKALPLRVKKEKKLTLKQMGWHR
jgi:beta-glucosidase